MQNDTYAEKKKALANEFDEYSMTHSERSYLPDGENYIYREYYQCRRYGSNEIVEKIIAVRGCNLD